MVTDSLSLPTPSAYVAGGIIVVHNAHITNQMLRFSRARQKISEIERLLPTVVPPPTIFLAKFENEHQFTTARAANMFFTIRTS